MSDKKTVINFLTLNEKTVINFLTLNEKTQLANFWLNVYETTDQEEMTEKELELLNDRLFFWEDILEGLTPDSNPVKEL